MAVLATPHVRAQAQVPAARLAFDVASVKPNKSGNAIMTASNPAQPGGRFTATNYNLRRLIAVAFNLYLGQTQNTLLGKPDWIDSEHFDIEAETEGNPTIDQKRLMLQSLLSDRFKLMAHHETRQLPVYALVLSKPGKTGP